MGATAAVTAAALAGAAFAGIADPAAMRPPATPTVAATRAPEMLAWPRTLVSSANTLNDWVER